ncbi:phosphatidylinositol phosphatase PTPRQ-like [Montipora foliosa]|uniref:phosphatidylinositol phosphatase PTPRQ-like n=1 Tax=Montipora foliosa TaxID=591990 RepID=UPI0035F1EDEA
MAGRTSRKRNAPTRLREDTLHSDGDPYSEIKNNKKNTLQCDADPCSEIKNNKKNTLQCDADPCSEIKNNKKNTLHSDGDPYSEIKNNKKNTLQCDADPCSEIKNNKKNTLQCDADPCSEIKNNKKNTLHSDGDPCSEIKNNKKNTLHCNGDLSSELKNNKKNKQHCDRDPSSELKNNKKNKKRKRPSSHGLAEPPLDQGPSKVARRSKDTLHSDGDPYSEIKNNKKNTLHSDGDPCSEIKNNKKNTLHCDGDLSSELKNNKKNKQHCDRDPSSELKNNKKNKKRKRPSSHGLAEPPLDQGPSKVARRSKDTLHCDGDRCSEIKNNKKNTLQCDADPCSAIKNNKKNTLQCDADPCSAIKNNKKNTQHCHGDPSSELKNNKKNTQHWHGDPSSELKNNKKTVLWTESRLGLTLIPGDADTGIRSEKRPAIPLEDKKRKRPSSHGLGEPPLDQGPSKVARTSKEPNAPPAYVSGDNTGSTSIFVQWNQVPAADKNGVILSYTVTFRALPDGSEQTRKVNAPTNNGTLTALNEYTNYSITVLASTSKGDGTKSAPIVVRTDEDKPNAPPAYVSGHNTGSTSIFVQWNQVPAADKNGVILSYTVTFRALPDGSEQTRKVNAPTNNGTLTALNEYTNYSITVLASTSKGDGTKSAPIVVRTDEDKPNAPPAYVSGHNTGSTSIFVQWNQVPAADKNGVILSYTVTFRALPDGSEQTRKVNAPTNNGTLTALNEYTNYSITVLASTSKGDGTKSAPIVVRTDEDKPNAPPAYVSGHNTGSTSIFVQWNQVPAADKNGVILSYTVTFRALPDGSEQTRKVNAPTNNGTLTALNEYTNYSITVLASTSKGDGTKSAPIVVRTDEDKPNAPPAYVSGHNTGSTSIFVQWNQVPAADKNGVILSYTVTFRALPDGSEQTRKVNAPTNNGTLTALNEYTNYSITVLASTSKGDGTKSAPIVVRTDEDKPNAPPAYVSGHNTGSTSIFVQWNQVPAADKNGVILSYTVTFRALPDGSEQTRKVNAPTNNGTLTALNEYTNYSITVLASTSKGDGTKSAPIVVRTDEDKPNAPPAYVSGHNTGSTSIFVQWNQVPAADKNGVILSYTVTFRALPDGSEQTRKVNAPTNNGTLTALNEYTNYSITVLASTSKGDGTKSAPIVVRTDEDKPNAPPAYVSGHNTGSTSIFVQWNQVPAADKNGVILSYTVTFRALPDGSEQTRKVNAPTNNGTLTALNEYTNYSITVLASTSKGDGTKSAPIVVRTDEDNTRPRRKGDLPGELTNNEGNKKEKRPFSDGLEKPPLHQGPSKVTRTIKEGTPSDTELEDLSLNIGDAWKHLGRRLRFTEAQLIGFHKQNEEYSENLTKCCCTGNGKMDLMQPIKSCMTPCVMLG